MSWIRVLAMVLVLTPAVLGAEEWEPLAKGNTAFACDLYANVRGEDGNLFFSPYSVSTALAMTREGAGGQTARQMDAVFGFPAAGRGSAFRALASAMKAPLARQGFGRDAKQVPAYELAIANRLWGQERFTFKQPFLDVLLREYSAPLELLDFSQSQAARKHINGWVEKQTKDRIRDLLPEGVPTPDTRLVLVNAVYFKSQWQSPFSSNATKTGPFVRQDGSPVEVPMMHKAHRFAYGEVEGVQVLEMPYRSRQLTMVVVLPRAKDGLPGVEKSLSPQTLASWVGALRSAKVDVTFPKFQFEKGFDLTKVLAEMGMPDAFRPELADFSAMTDAKLFYIGFVLHKGFVAVDEKGTEAAAATAVGMRMASAPQPELPVPFVADHPFLFFIRHQPTGTILFMGRVADPK